MSQQPIEPQGQLPKLATQTDLRTPITQTPQKKNPAHIIKRDLFTKKKRKSCTEDSNKIEAMLQKLNDDSTQNDAAIIDFQKRMSEKDKLGQPNEMFAMVGRRMLSMSAGTQSWMEGQLWDMYQQAKRMEDNLQNPPMYSGNTYPPAAQYTSYPNIPTQPVERRNMFDLMNESYNLLDQS